MSKVATVIEKTYSGFDLETLSTKEVPVKVEFVPATDLQDGMARLGSQEKLLAAVNSALREETLAKARESAQANFVSKAAVMKYVNPYRQNKPFSDLVTTNRGQDGWKEQYAAQTDAILEAIKNVPFIMDAIRTAPFEDSDSQ